MDVNARRFRLSESRSNVRQVCDMGDETVEHAMVECMRYARDRNEMMHLLIQMPGLAVERP
ncbi:hypothetical protein E2C01_074625 [Portunus trituberculatus]|uniref:Uncharacterized protein n=1 Tax=Portunus trituberculatus TaxID=210409 RepID=A0A5B7I3S3_PORTR|nr:hypothetical protein [Portunus trituberculatus]